MARGETEVVSEIMDSISRLKDSKGSSVYKILDDISAHRPTQRKNASFQIKKALKSAVKSGLVREKDGLFKLGLGPKDYATLNLFRKKGTSLPIKQLRGRRRRRSRSRKRRGKRRRRSHYEGIEFLEKSFGDKDDILGLIPTKNLKPKSPWNLPIKQLRRRRGRRGRSRRKRGRRRRRGGFDDLDSVGKDSDEGFSEPMDRGRRRRSRRRGRKRRGRRRDAGSDEEIESASFDLKNTSKASKDKPKSADNPKPEPNNAKPESQKPEPVSPEPTKTPEKSYYIHEDHPWDGPYGQHYYPPYSAHYGDHYYRH